MLTTRGYHLHSTGTLVEHIVDVTELNNDTVLQFRNSGGDVVFVVLSTADKLGIALLRTYVTVFEAYDVKHALVFVRISITPQANQNKKLLLHNLNMRVEMLTLSELNFDIMKHVKVPPHRKLNVDEVRQLQLDTDKQQLLLASDPVSRYMGLLPGDVVEITRHTPTSRMLVYRVVTNG